MRLALYNYPKQGRFLCDLEMYREARRSEAKQCCGRDDRFLRLAWPRFETGGGTLHRGVAMAGTGQQWRSVHDSPETPLLASLSSIRKMGTHGGREERVQERLHDGKAGADEADVAFDVDPDGEVGDCPWTTTCEWFAFDYHSEGAGNSYRSSLLA